MYFSVGKMNSFLTYSILPLSLLICLKYWIIRCYLVLKDFILGFSLFVIILTLNILHFHRMIELFFLSSKVMSKND